MSPGFFKKKAKPPSDTEFRGPLDLVPGESARGRWQLTGDEWFFQGHFPGRPTLPGVLMCEAIAQVGAAV